jgi:DNA-binding response OmpR family regulator
MVEYTPSSDLRVAVVEDDDRLRHLIYKVLVRAGFQTYQAATSRQAAALLENERPHIMLLDLELPDGNGLKLLNAAKRGTDHSPQVVVLTGHERYHYYAEEIEHFLYKPVSMQMLVDYVTRLASVAVRSGLVLQSSL